MQLGNLEYGAQSNGNANCVNPDSRFKSVDDLSTLEKITLLTIGMTSHNSKLQVPNDIIDSNLFIPPNNLNSQKYLNTIQKWTKDQKMILNEEKTKTMVFNFTKNKQFSTRLSLNGKTLETVNEMKLLGTIITNDLKWNKNTHFLIKKAHARMEILRQLTNFTKSTKDRLQIYKIYIRSVVEQSAVVWNSSLTKYNERELERVQKVAVKLISKKDIPYKEKLIELGLPSLKERRNQLSVNFAKKNVSNMKEQKACLKRTLKYIE